MNAPRRCCRPGCPHYAVATLTFVYSDSTAVVGPLATAREPHSWDLCVGHAGRITAPRGWDLVRHSGPLAAHPEDDDLIALADAVREGTRGRPSPAGDAASGAKKGWYPQPESAESNGQQPVRGVLAPVAPHPKGATGNGRRRGHLRVLPDPRD